MSAKVNLLAQGSVEIQRPRPEVFAYVTNLENFAAWFPGVAAIHGEGGLGHAQVGKRYRETLRMPFGRIATVDIEVKGARAEALFVTEGSGFLMPGMSVDFAALPDGGTRVDWRMVSRNQRRWFRWLLLPLLRRVMGRRARAGLRKLRSVLEGAP
jgi:carbon monoxide dehydrogenase subunit G